MTTTTLTNSSSSLDSSGDEHTAQVAKWDAGHPQEGSFLQKKTDLDDKVVTTGGGKRKSKREKKKAIAVNKVGTDSECVVCVQML